MYKNFGLQKVTLECFFLNPVWCKEIGSKQEEITKTSTTYKPCLLFQTGKLIQRGKSLAHNRGNT